MNRLLFLLLLSAIALGGGLLPAAAIAAASVASAEVDLTSNDPAGETNDRIDSEDPADGDVTWHEPDLCGRDASSQAAPAVLPLLHARSIEPLHPPPRA